MATWFSGIIPASGAGPGFDSRSGPFLFLQLICMSDVCWLSLTISAWTSKVNVYLKSLRCNDRNGKIRLTASAINFTDKIVTCSFSNNGMMITQAR